MDCYNNKIGKREIECESLDKENLIVDEYDREILPHDEDKLHCRRV